MILEGAHVSLRALEPEDLDFLFRVENNTEFWEVILEDVVEEVDPIAALEDERPRANCCLQQNEYQKETHSNNSADVSLSTQSAEIRNDKDPNRNNHKEERHGAGVNEKIVRLALVTTIGVQGDGLVSQRDACGLAHL